MNSSKTRALNETFVANTGSQEGLNKLAAFGGPYIRDRLREVSFARKVIPPEPVTRADCQRSLTHDTLVKIVDIEPQSRAMALTFRGAPTARLIRAPRYAIPFFTISSEKFEKTEQELLAYEMPITKIIEDNSVKDIQEIEDREFLRHIETSVQQIQIEANAGAAARHRAADVVAAAVVQDSVIKGAGAIANQAVNDFTIHAIVRPDFVNLFKRLDGKRLRSERVLMTEPDYDDILQWTMEDVGNKVVTETTIDGYKYDTIMGRKLIRTVKTDLLRVGNVYCFTAPEFFGKFYLLNSTKFYIDKIANLITWQSWEDIGMGIGNISSVVKLELFTASVVPGFQDAGFAALLPSAEEDLGAVNNRADQGLTYPVVDQF